ncbi:TetR/AcrR family transcriptional regulator [Actinocrispum sp. NPDC049592]|uniref:TetR/AcrR family transcriptional regulator n=1 Tax=Actinocrispum sp. NPDC049592 TaxID=3154835 RepID=UPI0034403373
MTGEEGLRERKKRETRLALSQAALRLCVQRGWDNVTVDEIAAEADVSVRTFRNYFSSKAEAVAASHAERTLRIADEIRARPAEEPFWDAVVAAVLAQFDGGPPGPGHDRWIEGVKGVLAQPAVHGEVLKASVAAEDALADAVACRTGTEGLYPHLVAGVIGSAIAAGLREWVLITDLRGSVIPYLREAFERIRAGLPVT